jgi:hypothetical protein
MTALTGKLHIQVRLAEDELVVKDHIEQRAVHFQSAVVMDESQLSKLVHEKADPATRCPNHFRQRFLTNLRQ